jgi:hypothetical protein
VVAEVVLVEYLGPSVVLTPWGEDPQMRYRPTGELNSMAAQGTLEGDSAHTLWLLKPPSSHLEGVVTRNFAEHVAALRSVRCGDFAKGHVLQQHCIRRTILLPRSDDPIRAYRVTSYVIPSSLQRCVQVAPHGYWVPASRSLRLQLARAQGGVPPLPDTRSALHLCLASARTSVGDYLKTPRGRLLVLTAVRALGRFYFVPTAGLNEVIDYYNTRRKRLPAAPHKFQVVTLIEINMAAFLTVMLLIYLALRVRCSSCE